MCVLFLFSLDLKKKYTPSNKDGLILGKRSQGPIFGDGDLEITDRCNINNSLTYFPSTFTGDDYEWTQIVHENP